MALSPTALRSALISRRLAAFRASIILDECEPSAADYAAASTGTRMRFPCPLGGEPCPTCHAGRDIEMSIPRETYDALCIDALCRDAVAMFTDEHPRALTSAAAAVFALDRPADLAAVLSYAPADPAAVLSFRARYPDPEPVTDPERVAFNIAEDARVEHLIRTGTVWQDSPLARACADAVDEGRALLFDELSLAMDEVESSITDALSEVRDSIERGIDDAMDNVADIIADALSEMGR